MDNSKYILIVQELKLTPDARDRRARPRADQSRIEQKNYKRKITFKK
tara:strand:+ start:222 stop:362 length:141 start_codon:yes stop_codon:yes gene_type:complete